MNLLTKYIYSEVHFYKSLSSNAQKLFLSSFLYAIAGPIIGLFFSAFLWRETQSVLLIVLYNITSFLGTTIGFYINGRLLKKIPANILFFYGCIMQGVTIIVLTFVPFFHNSQILLYGIIMGIAGGFFWANRTSITKNATKSNERIYFSSLESVGGIVTGMVVPLLTGWFIVLGGKFDIYTPKFAYNILGIFLMIILFTTAYIAKKIQITKSPLQNIRLHNPSKQWKNFRLFTFLIGFSNSIEIVIPGLALLTLGAKENSLGTIGSVCSVMLAFSIYIIGKKTNKESRSSIFIIGIVLSIIASSIFGLWFSIIGIFIYSVVNSFSGSFRWMMMNPIMFDVIESEEKRYNKHEYPYLFDQQLYLNHGRYAALIIFLILFVSGNNTILRFAPFLFALPQLIIAFILTSIEKNLVEENIRENAFDYNLSQEKEV